MRSRWLTLGLVLAGRLAAAQPISAPSDTPPLAQLHDDELAQALASITQDPAIHVDDAKVRPLAAALMKEGVKQLHARAYEQALANFLEAYHKFPSPTILLEIASTLRDMGRLADAANTYQRYLADPATGPQRVAEVEKLLAELDRQLTRLTVRVSPKGSEISIDGGPFIPVGAALVTRVRPGIHQVRIRNGGASDELTINGFEGEAKDVVASVAATAAAPALTGEPVPTRDEPPDQVFGWLDTGTQYKTSDVTSRERTVLAGDTGSVVRAIVPDLSPDDEPVIVEAPSVDPRIRSGVVGVVRIDGKARGAAAGLGVAFAPLDTVELELAALRSDHWGAYAGLRVRFSTGWVRPYGAFGLPAFVFEDENDAMRTKVALALRGAGGVELELNEHLSVKGELGIEYFFNIGDDVVVGGKRPERTVFVPALGVVGRL